MSYLLDELIDMLLDELLEELLLEDDDEDEEELPLLSSSMRTSSAKAMYLISFARSDTLLQNRSDMALEVGRLTTLTSTRLFLNCVPIYRRQHCL